MRIRSIFRYIHYRLVTPQGEMSHPVFRYGILVFTLFMCAQQIKWHFTPHPGYSGDPYRIDVLVLILLFNHLAMMFQWPRRIAGVLWLLAVSWLGFASFYLFYLSRVLYP